MKIQRSWILQYLLVCIFIGHCIALRHIVEVDYESDLYELKSTIRARRADCLRALKPRLRHDLRSNVFKGVSVETSSIDTVSTISCFRSLGGVTQVWPSPKYKMQSLTQPTMENTHSEKALKAISNIVHQMTGVDRLHEQGITGKGATIAVIDSGVDYLHPGLGGGLGPGFKITYGRNLVGSDRMPPRNYSDLDPYTECQYHGTHVTGIATGNDSSIGFVGVAPGANVEHYRVIGCEDTAADADTVIKGVLEAYNRKVDVITVSLTLVTGPFPEDPLSAVFTRVCEGGNIICTIAAGNNGWKGAFGARAPGSSIGVISVGYVNAQQVIRSRPRAQFQLQNGSIHDFPWAPATRSRFPDILPLHAINLNTSIFNDACRSFDLDTKHKDSVILIRRGGCLFREKMDNINRAGGKYMLIYDNVDEPIFEIDNNPDKIRGAGLLSAKDGENLIDLLRSGERVVMKMDSNFTLLPYISNPEQNTLPEGLINAHSTWGPSSDARMMPSLLAPGQSILSTMPRSWGGYGVLSGSSMAAPYAAGCAALMKAARPDLSANEIIRLLISTSRPVNFNDGTNKVYDFLAPVWQQGGGLLNASRAAGELVIPAEPNISLNDTKFFSNRKDLSIYNTGHETIHYKISSLSTVSLLPLLERLPGVIFYNGNRSDFVASMEFLEALTMESTHDIVINPSELTLASGELRNISVVVNLSQTHSRARCPLYGGYVLLEGDKGSSFTIPYGGILCSLKDVPVISNNINDTHLSAATLNNITTPDYKSEPVAAFTTFQIPGPGVVINATNEHVLFPTIALNFTMYTRSVSMDLVQSGTSINGTGMSAFSETSRNPGGGFNRVDMTYFPWDGSLENGSWAQEGEYAFRICGARAWTNHNDLDAYADCTTTTPFKLQYTPTFA